MHTYGLSDELVSLICHVELNKVGWWYTAQQRIILSATRDLCIVGGTASIEAIVRRVAETCRFDIPEARLKDHFKTLEVQKLLLRLPDGTYKIPESTLVDIGKQIQDTKNDEMSARELFSSLIESNCPQLSGKECWPVFVDTFLIPFVRRLGANTYQIISSSQQDFDGSEFKDFLSKYPSECSDALHEVVSGFLGQGNISARTYVLRLLNGHFLLEASGLSEDSLQRLNKMYSHKPTFNLFLDTNFLFSILELHENPSNEAAVLLAKLISSIGENVTVKPYVLHPTVDEARFTINATKNRLRGVTLTPNLAEGAIDAGVYGLVQKFAEESRKAQSRIRAEDYFEPYLSNLVQVLRKRGVELFNEDLSEITKDQDFVDTINDQLCHEQEKCRGKAKGYEQLEHDLLLWFFVRNKRPKVVESPVDARFWIVTLDYRFLSFDTFMRRGTPFEIPFCVHPTTLTQMLQFWVPRSNEFEAAMLANMRLPFLFPRFDVEAEQVTINILGALARYGNIADLPRETVGAVLTNKALRNKLKDSQNPEETTALVSDTLIRENRETYEKLAKVQAAEAGLRTQNEQKEKRLRELETQVSEARSESLSAQESRATTENRVKELERGMMVLGEQLEKSLADDRERVIRQRFLWRYVIPSVFALVFTIAIGFSAVLIWFQIKHSGSWILMLLSLPPLLWVLWVHRMGGSFPEVRKSRLFVIFVKLHKWVLTLLGFGAAGSIGNACWELIKKLAE